MGKFRFRSHLDHALFVVLIMAGAVVTAVLDVQAISQAAASARQRSAAVAVAPAQARPSVAATSAPHAARPTLLARLAH
jgi:hypothetical protein